MLRAGVVEFHKPRRLPSIFASALVSTLAFICTPAPDAAAQLKVPTFSGQPQWGGTAGHLPFGPGVSEQELIQHAYTMPGVQEILGIAERRGYIPHPEDDRARIQQSPPVSMVVLPFERPAGWLPDGFEGAPVLLVASADNYGEPRTTLSLNFLLFDEATGEVTIADAYPQLKADHSVERDGERRMGGGGPGDRRVTPDHVDDGKFSSCAGRYYACAGLSMAQCVLSAVPVGNLWVAAAIITICFAREEHSCLHDFATCLDHSG